MTLYSMRLANSIWTYRTMWSVLVLQVPNGFIVITGYQSSRMSIRRGSALIAALIVISVLGFLWVGDFVLRLTEDISQARVIGMEQKHLSASAKEWEAFFEATARGDTSGEWQTIKYVISDGVSERVVTLRIAFVNDQWVAEDRQVVWRANVVSH
jgi:hypothetical protein